MDIRPKRLAGLVLALFIAAVSSGCMTASVDELYSLPRMSEEYVQLQQLIAQRLDEGSAYAAPTGGSNRQNVQLRDLDGDGAEEALVFLADQSGTPTVCLYRRDDGGDYYLAVIIEGDGSAVASADYADLTGDGIAELAIAWQISGELRLLSVYDVGGGEQAEPIQLLRADCTDFLLCDLDGDGVSDLADLQADGSGGELVLYDLTGERPVSRTAAFSGGITQVRRTVAGTLADGTPAVFVESELGGAGLVTDVFTAPDGELRNITMTALGRSNTLRPDGLYAADMDGDRALELPVSDSGQSDMLTWYSLDAGGHMTAAVRTCYNAEEGWYLVLTGLLEDELILEQYGSPGESAILFTVAGDGSTPQGSVLIICAVTGEDRLERAQMNDRFILRQTEDTVYAAQLLTDELDERDIVDNFYLIDADWQSGDL